MNSAPIGEIPGADAGEYFPTRYERIGDDVLVTIERGSEESRLSIDGSILAVVPNDDVDHLLTSIESSISLWRAS